MKVSSFQEVIEPFSGSAKVHLLLGNGFSRALRDDIFSYDALFDRANFKRISAEARKSFDELGTTDFEVVMKALRQASILQGVYEPNSDVGKRMLEDIKALRTVLASTIASNHPDRPSDVSVTAYAKCRRFLANFDHTYSLNYDLLLYWTVMQDEIEPPIEEDDGFRTPDGGPEEYVTWDVEKTKKQNLFFLHGALHLFDAGSELKKFTWKNTGVALIDQIRGALDKDMFPVIVAEGTSEQKVDRIMHSGYLNRGYRSFAEIGGTLVVFGHSMAESDQHIWNLIRKNKVRDMLVSLHDDPESPTNLRIRARANALVGTRPPRRPLKVQFFDAVSAAVWG
jgi:Domain of unknown function (DUF4917)